MTTIGDRRSRGDDDDDDDDARAIRGSFRRFDGATRASTSGV